MPHPTPNTELILDVLARIERDPDSWDQAWWGQETACGTKYCFAGHAVLAAGISLRFDRGLADFTADGHFVANRAEDLLGLTFEQRHTLFSAPTDLDAVYRICSDILGLDPQVIRDKVQDRVTS